MFMANQKPAELTDPGIRSGVTREKLSPGISCVTLGVNPTLTLVANSLYPELENCEVGAASLGKWGSVRPLFPADSWCAPRPEHESNRYAAALVV